LCVLLTLIGVIFYFIKTKKTKENDNNEIQTQTKLQEINENNVYGVLPPPNQYGESSFSNLA